MTFGCSCLLEDQPLTKLLPVNLPWPKAVSPGHADIFLTHTPAFLL